jgi:hypothetical protein
VRNWECYWYMHSVKRLLKDLAGGWTFHIVNQMQIYSFLNPALMFFASLLLDRSRRRKRTKPLHAILVFWRWSESLIYFLSINWNLFHCIAWCGFVSGSSLLWKYCKNLLKHYVHGADSSVCIVTGMRCLRCSLSSSSYYSLKFLVIKKSFANKLSFHHRRLILPIFT